MIEEPALRDSDRFDQFLDRSGGEALLDDRFIGDVHDPFARALTLGLRAAFQLYRGSTFLEQLVVHRPGSPEASDLNYHKALVFPTRLKSDRKPARRRDR